MNEEGQIQKYDDDNYDPEYADNFQINIDFDFTQREYIIHYLTFMDVFTSIGGMAASFGIIIY